VLYHGNLGVAENNKAAEYLVKNVFRDLPVKLVIAGQNPSQKLIRTVKKNPNISVVPDCSDEEMFMLIRNAQANILITFQATGLKLKLLNALFNARFCIVNPPMVTGTELGVLCEVGNDSAELQQKVLSLMTASFSESEISRRRQVLQKWHSNSKNCRTLMNFIYLLYHPS
jgi:hypothetical protein